MATLNLKEALNERRHNKILSLSNEWGDLFNSLNSVETKLSQAVRAEPDKSIYICDVYFTENADYIDYDTRRQIPNLFLPTCLVDYYKLHSGRFTAVPDCFPEVSINDPFPELNMKDNTFILEEIITSSKEFISFFEDKEEEFETLVYPRILEIFTKDFEVPNKVLSIHFLKLFGPNKSRIVLARFRIIP